MNIGLGKLKDGAYRKLTDQELDGLYELIKDSSNETVIDNSIKSRFPVNDQRR